MAAINKTKGGRIDLPIDYDNVVSNARLTIYGGITKVECVCRIIDFWKEHHNPKQYKGELIVV